MQILHLILLCRAVSTLLLHIHSGEVCSGQLHSPALLPLALCRSRCSVCGVCHLERLCGCGRQEPPSSLPPHPTSLLFCYICLLLCLWAADPELENSFQFCQAALSVTVDACPLRASSVWILSSEALHVRHMCTSYIPCFHTFPISCSLVCTIDRSRKRVPRPSPSFTALIDKPRTGPWGGGSEVPWGDGSEVPQQL